MSKLLEELNTKECRWPGQESEVPYTFCGEKTYCDSPYCKKHYVEGHRLDYKSAAVRKRETASYLKSMRKRNEKKRSA